MLTNTMRQSYQKNYSTALRKLTASAIGSVFKVRFKQIDQTIFREKMKIRKNLFPYKGARLVLKSEKSFFLENLYAKNLKRYRLVILNASLLKIKVHIFFIQNF